MNPGTRHDSQATNTDIHLSIRTIHESRTQAPLVARRRRHGSCARDARLSRTEKTRDEQRLGEHRAATPARAHERRHMHTSMEEEYNGPGLGGRLERLPRRQRVHDYRHEPRDSASPHARRVVLHAGVGRQRRRAAIAQGGLQSTVAVTRGQLSRWRGALCSRASRAASNFLSGSE